MTASQHPRHVQGINPYPRRNTGLRKRPTTAVDLPVLLLQVVVIVTVAVIVLVIVEIAPSRTFGGVPVCHPTKTHRHDEPPLRTFARRGRGTVDRPMIDTWHKSERIKKSLHCHKRRRWHPSLPYWKNIIPMMGKQSYWHHRDEMPGFTDVDVSQESFPRRPPPPLMMMRYNGTQRRHRRRRQPNRIPLRI
jgi:hypothetical protein